MNYNTKDSSAMLRMGMRVPVVVMVVLLRFHDTSGRSSIDFFRK